MFVTAIRELFNSSLKHYLLSKFRAAWNWELRD